MRQVLTKSLFFAFGAAALMLVCANPALAQDIATGNGCTEGTLGGMICNVINGTSLVPGIITGFAYMAGLIAGFMGIVKLREHVESPNNVQIWDPIKRFLMAGAFFSLPFVANVALRTIQGDGADTTGGQFNAGGASEGGLDAMIVKLMANIGAPTIWLIGWFGWVAGLVLVFIAISRLMKTEREGPTGPTGIGTITTILIAGCLFSLNSIIAFINGSLFDNNSLQTHAVLQYTQGLEGSVGHVHAVISAILMFSVVLGWISIARGLFIVRGVSEGNSQASMMAAITHLVGGVLAINLGGVLMATQTTLGIDKYGIVFTGGG